jgi:hypothetical protein
MKKKSGNKKRTLLNLPYTKRDIELVYMVFTKKYMTTPQLWALFFAHTKHIKVCQQRLRKLQAYGLLRAIEQAHKRGEGRPPYIWALDVLGGELLIRERGVDLQLINTKPRADEDKSLSIKHILATTDFQIVLQAACNQAGMTVEEWIAEREVRSLRAKEAAIIMGPGGQTLKVPIPDALFTISRHDKRALFHLEVDRATEDIELSTFERQSIAGKVMEYITWEESEPYRTEFGARPLRVCFVTVGMRRMQNMRLAAEKFLEQKLVQRPGLSEAEKRAEVARLGKRFRFITFVQLDPETLLTQPVWQIAGHERPGTLFE